MDPVTHFEMPATDKQRAIAFYSKTFGWRLQQLGPEMGEYVMAHTTETDPQGMVQTPGAINGGFYSPTDDAGSRAPSVVINVKDVKAAMAAIARNGGKMLGEPQQIPGVGMWASFLDTEGNRVSIIQSSR